MRAKLFLLLLSCFSYGMHNGQSVDENINVNSPQAESGLVAEGLVDKKKILECIRNLQKIKRKTLSANEMFNLSADILRSAEVVYSEQSKTLENAIVSKLKKHVKVSTNEVLQFIIQVIEDLKVQGKVSKEEYKDLLLNFALYNQSPLVARGISEQGLKNYNNIQTSLQLLKNSAENLKLRFINHGVINEYQTDIDFILNTLIVLDILDNLDDLDVDNPKVVLDKYKSVFDRFNKLLEIATKIDQFANFRREAEEYQRLFTNNSDMQFSTSLFLELLSILENADSQEYYQSLPSFTMALERIKKGVESLQKNSLEINPVEEEEEKDPEMAKIIAMSIEDMRQYNKRILKEMREDVELALQLPKLWVNKTEQILDFKIELEGYQRLFPNNPHIQHDVSVCLQCLLLLEKASEQEYPKEFSVFFDGLNCIRRGVDILNHKVCELNQGIQEDPQIQQAIPLSFAQNGRHEEFERQCYSLSSAFKGCSSLVKSDSQALERKEYAQSAQGPTLKESSKPYKSNAASVSGITADSDTVKNDGNRGKREIANSSPRVGRAEQILAFRREVEEYKRLFPTNHAIQLSTSMSFAVLSKLENLSDEKYHQELPSFVTGLNIIRNQVERLKKIEDIELQRAIAFSLKDFSNSISSSGDAAISGNDNKDEEVNERKEDKPSGEKNKTDILNQISAFRREVEGYNKLFIHNLEMQLTIGAFFKDLNKLEKATDQEYDAYFPSLIMKLNYIRKEVEGFNKNQLVVIQQEEQDRQSEEDIKCNSKDSSNPSNIFASDVSVSDNAIQDVKTQPANLNKDEGSQQRDIENQAAAPVDKMQKIADFKIEIARYQTLFKDDTQLQISLKYALKNLKTLEEQINDEKYAKSFISFIRVLEGIRKKIENLKPNSSPIMGSERKVEEGEQVNPENSRPDICNNLVQADQLNKLVEFKKQLEGLRKLFPDNHPIQNKISEFIEYCDEVKEYGIGFNLFKLMFEKFMIKVAYESDNLIKQEGNIVLPNVSNQKKENDDIDIESSTLVFQGSSQIVDKNSKYETKLYDLNKNANNNTRESSDLVASLTDEKDKQLQQVINRSLKDERLADFRREVEKYQQCFSQNESMQVRLKRFLENLHGLGQLNGKDYDKQFHLICSWFNNLQAAIKNLKQNPSVLISEENKATETNQASKPILQASSNPGISGTNLFSSDDLNSNSPGNELLRTQSALQGSSNPASVSCAVVSGSVSKEDDDSKIQQASPIMQNPSNSGSFSVVSDNAIQDAKMQPTNLNKYEDLKRRKRLDEIAQLRSELEGYQVLSLPDVFKALINTYLECLSELEEESDEDYKYFVMTIENMRQDINRFKQTGIIQVGTYEDMKQALAITHDLSNSASSSAFQGSVNNESEIYQSDSDKSKAIIKDIIKFKDLLPEYLGCTLNIPLDEILQLDESDENYEKRFNESIANAHFFMQEAFNILSTSDLSYFSEDEQMKITKALSMQDSSHRARENSANPVVSDSINNANAQMQEVRVYVQSNQVVSFVSDSVKINEGDIKNHDGESLILEDYSNELQLMFDREAAQDDNLTAAKRKLNDIRPKNLDDDDVDESNLIVMAYREKEADYRKLLNEKKIAAFKKAIKKYGFIVPQGEFSDELHKKICGLIRL